jgi:hypothetical protein
MTLENVLYSANGTARTDDGRLDIRVSPAAVSSILIFTASWKKWFCVLRRYEGFGFRKEMRMKIQEATPLASSTHEHFVSECLAGCSSRSTARQPKAKAHGVKQ